MCAENQERKVGVCGQIFESLPANHDLLRAPREKYQQRIPINNDLSHQRPRSSLRISLPDAENRQNQPRTHVQSGYPGDLAHKP